jgi:hypothetical protein
MEMRVDEALRLLEITPPVTIEQIRSQYRKMALRYSPDITRDPTTEHLFRLIIVAHEFLVKNFNLFFANETKVFSNPKTKPTPKNPTVTPTKKWKATQNYGGNWDVEIQGVGKIEIEKFNNGKSIRSLTLVSPQANPELLLGYLDAEKDEHEWFARIYGCSPQERKFLLDCGFFPLFPHDNPPHLTYLHRDLL